MECQPRQKRMLFISGSPEPLMLWQSLGIRPRRQSGVPLERNRSTLTWRQRKESAFGRKSSLAGQTRCIAYPPGRFCLCCETTGNFLLFVEPDIWELLERCAKIAAEEGAQILPEIHEHFQSSKNWHAGIIMCMTLRCQCCFYMPFILKTVNI